MTFNIRRIILLVLTVAFALGPAFSNGFGGFSNESFPVQLDRWPAQPAGWAFSIWGLIYLLLIVTSAGSVLFAQGRDRWCEVFWPLGLSFALGVFWVEAAMRSPLIATAMILPMAAGAIFAMLKLRSIWQDWLAVGLYAGWLTAASGVAVSIILSGYGIMAPRTAAILLIIVVLVVAFMITLQRPDIISYRAGVIWALIGVIAANIQAEDYVIAGLSAAGIATLVIAGQIFRKRQIQI